MRPHPNLLVLTVIVIVVYIYLVCIEVTNYVAVMVEGVVTHPLVYLFLRKIP